MKIIFLDIDGVICNEAQWMPSRADEYGYPFDLKAVSELGRIVALTGARIVISSTWRLSGILAMHELWKARRMPGYVYDVTPHRSEQLPSGLWTGGMRGHEIQDWLDQDSHDQPITHYVILDDMGPDAFLPHQRPFLIQTETEEGLTAALANKAIRLLTT